MELFEGHSQAIYKIKSVNNETVHCRKFTYANFVYRISVSKASTLFNVQLKPYLENSVKYVLSIACLTSYP